MDTSEIYNDAIIGMKRKGTSEDPYKQYSEPQTIINGKAQLTEIPNRFSKVRVSGDNKPWFEVDGGELTDTNYRVDYVNGIVHFNTIHNNKSLIFTYLGEGVLFNPASRIWTQQHAGSVTETLEDIIQIGRNIYQPPVNTFADIATTYPTPEHGWTVQTINDGRFYRWDSNANQWIHALTLNPNQITQLANEVGVVGDLSTLNKSNLVEAINEHDEEIGNTSALKTSDKSNLTNAINENVTRLANMGEDIKTLADLKAIIASNQKVTCNIGKVIEIAENITFTENLLLKFNNGGKLFIKSGFTLTLNSQIDAGYTQIFEFEDATANINTTILPNSAHSTIVHHKIKLDWFGAKPDAKSPDAMAAIDALPTGTDSTKAIKRAVTFCNQASTTWSELMLYPVPILEGTPNGAYFVKGDNILGNQLDTKTRNFTFEGNGCSFFWVPENNDDAFINRFAYYYRPKMADYRVHLYGFSGSKGIFCKTGETVGYVALSQPHFYDVEVHGGTEATGNENVGKGNAVKSMFDIGGQTMNDQFYLEKCRFYQFDKFLLCSNSESVSWKVFKTTIYSQKANAVFFEFTGQYSGGFDVDSCDLLMKGDNQTLFKTTTALSNPINGDFNVDHSRLETSANAFTLVNAHFGKFNIRGINSHFGSPAIHANSKAVELKHPATVYFTDCYLPKTFVLDAHTYDAYHVFGGNVESALILERCDIGVSPPVFKFKTIDGVERTFRWVFENNHSIRPFCIKNSKRFNCSYGMIFPTDDMRSDLPIFNQLFHGRHQYGYSYLNGTASMLPENILITSIKLVASSANLTETNRILVKIGAWETYVNLSDTVDTITEIIPANKRGVTVPSSGNYLQTFYYLNTAESVNPVPAHIIITYRRIMDRLELTGTDAPKMI